MSERQKDAHDLEQLGRTIQNREVILLVTDSLVVEGYLPPGVPLTEELIRSGIEMAERPPYVGQLVEISQSLHPKFRTWGFRTFSAVKGDLATVFHFGVPVMTVQSDRWDWIDPFTENGDGEREHVRRAADFLENWGVEAMPFQREEFTWDGVRELVDEIQERAL